MGMEKYLGYSAAGAAPEPERNLPVVSIYGTEFVVDIGKHEFREVTDPFNRMTLGDVPENEGHFKLFYNIESKNIYLGSQGLHSKYPPCVRVVLVPSLKTLDPIGLAKRQGLSQSSIISPPAVRELKCIRPQSLKAKKRGKSI